MRNIGALILAALAALLLAGCGLDSAYVDEEGNPQPNPGVEAGGYDAAKDVKLTSCKAGEFGGLTAKLKITNNDDQPRSYMITAEAVAGGERVAELNAVANTIRPGQSTTTRADGMTDGAEAPKKFKCKVVSVDSFND